MPASVESWHPPTPKVAGGRHFRPRGVGALLNFTLLGRVRSKRRARIELPWRRSFKRTRDRSAFPLFPPQPLHHRLLRGPAGWEVAGDPGCDDREQYGLEQNSDGNRYTDGPAKRLFIDDGNQDSGRRSPTNCFQYSLDLSRTNQTDKRSGQPIAAGFLGTAALNQPGFQKRIQQIHGSLFGDPHALANFLGRHRPAVP